MIGGSLQASSPIVKAFLMWNHGRSLSGARGEGGGAKPPYEATYFQAFRDGGYCDNNMLNGWWAFNDKSDMLLTLLASKKSRVSVKFLLPTSYQLKAKLVNYHNFYKQSPGAMI